MKNLFETLLNEVYKSEEVISLEREKAKIYQKKREWIQRGKDVTDLQTQYEDVIKRLKQARLNSKTVQVKTDNTADVPAHKSKSLLGDLDDLIDSTDVEEESISDVLDKMLQNNKWAVQFKKGIKISGETVTLNNEVSDFHVSDAENKFFSEDILIDTHGIHYKHIDQLIVTVEEGGHNKYGQRADLPMPFVDNIKNHAKIDEVNKFVISSDCGIPKYFYDYGFKKINKFYYFANHYNHPSDFYNIKNLNCDVFQLGRSTIILGGELDPDKFQSIKSKESYFDAAAFDIPGIVFVGKEGRYTGMKLSSNAASTMDKFMHGKNNFGDVYFYIGYDHSQGRKLITYQLVETSRGYKLVKINKSNAVAIGLGMPAYKYN